MGTKLSREHIEQIHHAFSNFDLDGDGFITRREFSKILKVPESELGPVFREFDQNEDDRISFEEFLLMVEKKFLKTFAKMDPKGTGHITLRDLKKSYERAGLKMSDKEVAAYMKTVDADENGLISFEEYIMGNFDALGLKNRY